MERFVGRFTIGDLQRLAGVTIALFKARFECGEPAFAQARAREFFCLAKKQKPSLRRTIGVEKLRGISRNICKVRFQGNQHGRGISAHFRRQFRDGVCHYRLVAPARKQARNFAERLYPPPCFIVRERRPDQPDESPKTFKRFAAFVDALRLHFRHGEFMKRRVELLARDAAKALLNRLVDLEPVRHMREEPWTFDWQVLARK